MNNYLANNPVAKQFLIDSLKLNENASVDNLLKKATEIVLDTFKKIVFDLSNKKNRSADSLKLKLVDVGSSTTVKNLVAKIKDYAEESELGDSKFAEVKQMYLKALSQISDALKRLIEVDPKMGDITINNFKELSDRLVKSLSDVTELRKSLKESQQFEELLVESIFTGYKGRIDKLKKKLVNLISDSKGKDAKNGYGRDWQRLFFSLDQKLSAIDTAKNVIGEKDRKNLSDLEKQVDNLAQEYYNYKIKATEQAMKKIVDDDELITKFSDVNDMITSALDMISKANVQESIIELKIREDLEELESKINEKVFPIKNGNKDSDAKFKRSGLIAAVQKALMDAFPSINQLLNERGGADGKYGDRTTVAIKAIQSVFGNKNANGMLDKPLMDAILGLDQISDENKKAINKSLESLKTSYSVSENKNHVISMSDYLSEASVFIDNEDLEKEIKKHSEDIANSPVATSNVKRKDSTLDKELASDIAKMLRKGGYNKNAEDDSFLREDGTFKSSYPSDVMEAWYETLVANEDNSKKPIFFWVEEPEGGIGTLHATKRLNGLDKPYNWPKWKELSDETDEEDIDLFAKWYTGYYSVFAGINNSRRLEETKKMLQSNSNPDMDQVAGADEDDAKRYKSDYDKILDIMKSNATGETKVADLYSRGYITPSLMKQLVESAKRGAQVNEKDPDLGLHDFLLLANLVSIAGGCFTWDKESGKWLPAIQVLTRDALTPEVIERVSQDKIFTKGSKNHFILNLIKESPGMVSSNVTTDVNTRKVFLANLKRAQDVIKKTIETHIRKINLENSDNVTDAMKTEIYVVPESNNLNYY